MLRLSPILLISLFGMVGCKPVQPTDVVGTWVMSDETRHDLPPELQKASGILFVRADGTFDAKELPEDLEPTNGKAHIRLDSGTGTWVFATLDGGQDLELQFHKFVSGDADNGGTYGFPLGISKTWSAWELHYFLGDPDNAPRVTLVRR